MFKESSIQKLNVILKEFYTIAKVRIAIIDENFNTVTEYPKEKPVICRLIQSKMLHLCSDCDRNAMEYGFKEKKLYIYRCHAGLTECVMPIAADTDNPVGYIMLGHMYAADDISAKERIIAKCAEYGIDTATATDALSKLNALDRDYITAVAHISSFIASYILTENIYTVDYDDIPIKVAAYLQENYKNPVTVKELSQKFGVGKTTLYKLFSQKYGVGVASYLRKIRLGHARKLLVSTQNISISEVCEKCGFEDYNYFIVCFKKEFGQSPKSYAKNQK